MNRQRRGVDGSHEHGLYGRGLSEHGAERTFAATALTTVLAMILLAACGGADHGEAPADTAHAVDGHGADGHGADGSSEAGDKGEHGEKVAKVEHGEKVEHGAQVEKTEKTEEAGSDTAAHGETAKAEQDKTAKAEQEKTAKAEQEKKAQVDKPARVEKTGDPGQGTAVKRAAASAEEAQGAAAAIDGALRPTTTVSFGRDGPATVAEELTMEVLALRDSLTLISAFLVGALIALAWFSTQLIQWFIRLGYRLGLQRARWVDNFGMIGRLGIWVWAVTMILLRAWRIAPMITLFAAGLVAAGLMVGFVKHFENLSTGFALALRGRIKIGDQITVGEHTGMVRHIGLMQIYLRTPEGSVYLPNRLLAGEAVSIGRSRNSYPLRARLTASRAWPPQALEAARCVAALSPYRDVNSRVNVHSEADDGRALVVEIQVWSPRLLDAADKHLRTLLEANLRGMVEGE